MDKKALKERTLGSILSTCHWNQSFVVCNLAIPDQPSRRLSQNNPKRSSNVSLLSLISPQPHWPLLPWSAKCLPLIKDDWFLAIVAPMSIPNLAANTFTIIFLYREAVKQRYWSEIPKLKRTIHQGDQSKEEGGETFRDLSILVELAEKNAHVTLYWGPKFLHERPGY